MGAASKNSLINAGSFKSDYFFTGGNFFDFKKVFMNTASGALGFVQGTIGIYIIIAGAADTVTVTPRGNAGFTDNTGLTTFTLSSGSSVGFIPGDFERVATTGATIQICVVTRDLRQYE